VERRNESESGQEALNESELKANDEFSDLTPNELSSYFYTLATVTDFLFPNKQPPTIKASLA
jgi:hypothetical protein